MANKLKYHQILKRLSTWSPLGVNVILTKRKELPYGHQVEISPSIEAFIDLIVNKCKCISNKKEQTTLWPPSGYTTKYKINIDLVATK